MNKEKYIKYLDDNYEIYLYSKNKMDNYKYFDIKFNAILEFIENQKILINGGIFDE